MRKYVFSFASLFITVGLFAQDTHSPAYKAGYAAGKIVGILLVGGLILWIIFRAVRKK